MAKNKPERTCYVICPIGDKGSSTRRRSDQVLKHLIEPAASKFGYLVRRSDSDADPGEIPAQIISQMVEADLVIADLSDFNPNVFYELAIRHVAAKPLVQMITRGQELPFDIGHMRTVYFNLADPDELEEARDELISHVEALQEMDEMETPIKASLRLKQALESSDPATAGNAAVLAEVQAIRSEVERLRAHPTTWQMPKNLRLKDFPEITGTTIGGKLSPEEVEKLTSLLPKVQFSAVQDDHETPKVEYQEDRPKSKRAKRARRT